METKIEEYDETKTAIALKKLDVLEAAVVEIRKFVLSGVLEEFAETGIQTSMAYGYMVCGTVYVYVRSRSQLAAARKILRAHGGRGCRLRNVSPCYIGGVYPVWDCDTMPWLELHWQGMDIEEAKAMGILKDTCHLETVTDTRNTLVCDI